MPPLMPFRCHYAADYALFSPIRRFISPCAEQLLRYAITLLHDATPLAAMLLCQPDYFLLMLMPLSADAFHC